MLLCCAVIALVTGCSSHPAKTEIQYVDRPIFACPTPPSVESIQLMTPSLTDADINNPGKVAQMYKADIIQLLDQNNQYSQVLDAYVEASKQLQGMQKELDELYKKNATTLHNTVPAQ